jgi:hypothetical protein
LSRYTRGIGAWIENLKSIFDLGVGAHWQSPSDVNYRARPGFSAATPRSLKKLAVGFPLQPLTLGEIEKRNYID